MWISMKQLIVSVLFSASLNMLLEENVLVMINNCQGWACPVQAGKEDAIR